MFILYSPCMSQKGVGLYIIWCVSACSPFVLPLITPWVVALLQQLNRWGGRGVGRWQSWPLQHRQNWIDPTYTPLISSFFSPRSPLRSLFSSPLECEELQSVRSHPEDLIKYPIRAWIQNADSSCDVMMGGNESLFGTKIPAYANWA